MSVFFPLFPFDSLCSRVVSRLFPFCFQFVFMLFPFRILLLPCSLLVVSLCLPLSPCCLLVASLSLPAVSLLFPYCWGWIPKAVWKDLFCFPGSRVTVRPALLFVSLRYRKETKTISRMWVLSTGWEPLDVHVPKKHPTKGWAAIRRIAHEGRGRGREDSSGSHHEHQIVPCMPLLDWVHIQRGDHLQGRKILRQKGRPITHD